MALEGRIADETVIVAGSLGGVDPGFGASLGFRVQGLGFRGEGLGGHDREYLGGVTSTGESRSVWFRVWGLMKYLGGIHPLVEAVPAVVFVRRPAPVRVLVSGLGFGVSGLGFGLWFLVWGLGFRVWGLRFRVWGLGFGVQSFGSRVPLLSFEFRV